MKKVLAVIVVAALVIFGIFEVGKFKWNECRMVGHSFTYCLITVGQ